MREGRYVGRHAGAIVEHFRDSQEPYHDLL
jgi:hypothetical protein